MNSFRSGLASLIFLLCACGSPQENLVSLKGNLEIPFSSRGGRLKICGDAPPVCGYFAIAEVIKRATKLENKKVEKQIAKHVLDHVEGSKVSGIAVGAGVGFLVAGPPGALLGAIMGGDEKETYKIVKEKVVVDISVCQYEFIDGRKAILEKEGPSCLP